MPVSPLVRVGELLNEEGARYLVCSGHAVILHGIIRTTEDVDILIEELKDLPISRRIVNRGRRE